MPIGTAADPFTGTFDGSYHTLSDLEVFDLVESDSVGLFGTAVGATIQKVRLRNSEVFGFENVGALRVPLEPDSPPRR
ncbi:hypothetical protein Poly30_43260 [Planctomycetes bacterium Poly30]|uniref:Uncharacterized protein n=1 Tax=Saltatorellus ferox TaxID=2528018 RepID=A0A518EXH5_9BACT|nr:hypothetical protein Poly30_43260 [Planctomycetes bacterium Poly30]